MMHRKRSGIIHLGVVALMVLCMLSVDTKAENEAAFSCYPDNTFDPRVGADGCEANTRTLNARLNSSFSCRWGCCENTGVATPSGRFLGHPRGAYADCVADVARLNAAVSSTIAPFSCTQYTRNDDEYIVITSEQCSDFIRGINDIAIPNTTTPTNPESRLVLRLRAVNGTVADLSPAAHRLTTAGKNGAEPRSAVRDFSELNMHTGDGQAEFIISTSRTSVRTDYFVVEPTDAEKDLSAGSAAGVFERASNSWSVSTWIKLSKYEWTETTKDHSEALVILSDLENNAGVTTGRDDPKYLEIHNGYMSYALGGDNSQYHAKHATTQRIPLGEWAHLEWSVVDGTIRTYVNGVQTDLMQGPGVRWGPSDSKLHIFGSPRYNAGDYMPFALWNEMRLEAGPLRRYTEYTLSTPTCDPGHSTLGSAATAAPICGTCPVATYSADGGPCTPCPAGTWTNAQVGQSACTKFVQHAISAALAGNRCKDSVAAVTSTGSTAQAASPEECAAFVAGDGGCAGNTATFQFNAASGACHCVPQDCPRFRYRLEMSNVNLFCYDIFDADDGGKNTGRAADTYLYSRNCNVAANALTTLLSISPPLTCRFGWKNDYVSGAIVSTGCKESLPAINAALPADAQLSCDPFVNLYLGTNNRAVCARQIEKLTELLNDDIARGVWTRNEDVLNSLAYDDASWTIYNRFDLTATPSQRYHFEHKTPTARVGAAGAWVAAEGYGEQDGKTAAVAEPPLSATEVSEWTMKILSTPAELGYTKHNWAFNILSFGILVGDELPIPDMNTRERQEDAKNTDCMYGKSYPLCQSYLWDGSYMFYGNWDLIVGNGNVATSKYEYWELPYRMESLGTREDSVRRKTPMYQTGDEVCFRFDPAAGHCSIVVVRGNVTYFAGAFMLKAKHIGKPVRITMHVNNVGNDGNNGAVMITDVAPPTVADIPNNDGAKTVVGLLVRVGSATKADSAFWDAECQRLPSTTQYIIVLMGAVLDYFKPIDDETSFCDMLTSNDKHLWSPNGVDWQQPTYANAGQSSDKGLGGSSDAWPRVNAGTDERDLLSMWGYMDGAERGGCCSRSKKVTSTTGHNGGTDAWAQDFDMWYVDLKTSTTTSTAATTVTASSSSTTPVTATTVSPCAQPDPPECLAFIAHTNCSLSVGDSNVTATCQALCGACNGTSAAEQQTTNTSGSTVAGVMLALAALACAAGWYVWYDHRRKQQQQQARDAVMGGGDVLEMVDNPLRRGGEAHAGAGVGAGAVNGDGKRDGDGDDDGARDGGAPVYAPPAFLPPPQEFPAYYSDVAAGAPETAAEYAAPNALPSSAVYNSGQDGGAVTAAYTKIDNNYAVSEGGAALYTIPSEGGGISMYAATRMDGGMGDDGALYTNNAYGNVAGSTI